MSEKEYDESVYGKEIDVRQLSNTEKRLLLGEAWALCTGCNGKLWSFDGESDKVISCPYMKNGKCEA